MAVKVPVETTSLERAFINAGSERAARDTAKRLWPRIDPKLRNIVVAIIRGQTDKDDPCPTK